MSNTSVVSQLDILDNALPVDTKRRLSLGQHESERIRHGDRIQRKSCIKQSAKARKFGKKPDLPVGLHRQLFSDEPGPLSIYDGYKLDRRERGQLKMLRKDQRRFRKMVGQPQAA